MNRGNDPILALGATWLEQFGNALEAMGDERPALDVISSSATPDGPCIWWKQPLDASPGAAVWIGMAAEAGTALGQRILSAAGVDSTDPAELQSTYLEIVRQSLGTFASAVGAQIGRQVVCTDGCQEEPPRDRTVGCEITIGFAGGRLPSITFLLNKEMLEAVAFSDSPGAQPDGSDPWRSPEAPVQELSLRASSTLNLLMDVELPVSVSFGRTRVRVQEILKLITGSIIELERSISEPVEVIVNNCVIARGEVVVVDGNYGVRITEVMSRQQRLQESQRSLLISNRAAAGATAGNPG